MKHESRRNAAFHFRGTVLHSFFVAILTVCPLLLPIALRAQSDTATAPLYKITFRDGTVVFGRFISKRPEKEQFRTTTGQEIDIRLTAVEKLEIISKEDAVDILEATNQNASRMLFTATATPLRAGQVYIGTQEVAMPLLGVGVTDFFNVAFGFLYVAPRITPIRVGPVDISAGVYYFVNKEMKSGLAEWNTTYTSERFSVTAGSGWNFESGEADGEMMMILGGSYIMNERLTVMTENLLDLNGRLGRWFPFGGLEWVRTVLSIGVRVSGNNIATDLAMVFPIGENPNDSFAFIPWLGFVYNL